MNQHDRWLRIGELAAVLQTTTKTIRFYESKGLLPKAKRSKSGYRFYGEAAIRQTRRVLGLRRLGLSIDELRIAVNVKSNKGLRKHLVGLLDEKLRQQDLELSVLQGRRDDLAARHQALLSTARERPPDCICDALLVPCSCGKS